MKIKRRKRGHGAMEASSLADILFFLMLFFLMVSTLASQNALGIKLPESRTGKSMHQELLSVSINAQRQYFINGKEATYADYEAALKEKSITSPNITIALRIDETVPVSELIKAVDVINVYKLHSVISTAEKK
ncbi:ExbD/TolR family protein [Cytophaga aurantiaca]|uniref:ExbD/TolR family protein n=1 Tax=Cytophaga aurantiaca TaxID=29530 RepID=UPI00037E472B|nr:biopolymer transporter ExbD [Cytophaga aurantiaca]